MQIFQNSAYNTWELVMQFGIIALMLMIANIVRRKVKIFRNLLFPTSIIAGFIGLAVRYMISGLDIRIDGVLILDVNFLK